MLADTAKTQFNVTGAGVTVGVLSYSVSKLNNGLPDSVASGDLPKKADGTANVNVLFEQNDPAAFTDEGRAMLEHIHDIAPGAGLAFHAASSLTGGETVLAAGIQAPGHRGDAKVIVDDVSFRDEPYYQDGIVGQRDQQRHPEQRRDLSQLRRQRGRPRLRVAVPRRDGQRDGLGTGRFMNFDPGRLRPLTAAGHGQPAGASSSSSRTTPGT